MSRRQDTCSGHVCSVAIFNGFLRDHGKIIDAPSLRGGEGGEGVTKASFVSILRNLIAGFDQFEFDISVMIDRLCRYPLTMAIS